VSNYLFAKTMDPALYRNNALLYGLQGNSIVSSRPIPLSSPLPQQRYRPIPAPMSYSYPQSPLPYSFQVFRYQQNAYSNTGLEYVLIAILILVSLDLIFIRPPKSQLTCHPIDSD
jgi:hypothetical protein